MKKFYFKFMFAIMALASVVPAIAQDSRSTVMFSYLGEDPVYTTFGTKRAETYDVAISLVSPAFTGKNITEINVPVPCQIYREQIAEDGSTVNTPCFSNLKVWLTENLDRVTEEGTDLPLCISCDWPEDNTEGFDFGWVNVKLPENYSIPESGVFVGYSMTVDLLESEGQVNSRYPVIVAPGNRQDALWLRTTRSYKQWGDRGQTNSIVSALSVKLEGCFPDNSVIISGIESYRADKGKEGQVVVHLNNAGKNPVSELNYITKFGDESYEGVISLANSPIPAIFNFPADVVVSVPASETTGTLNLTVEFTKVNNQNNDSEYGSKTIKASVPLFVPANTPLVEEFTGTGCGYCPRGFVSLEVMNSLYPDSFLAVAWHGFNDTDPMYPKTGFPNIFGGAPSCVYNRGSEIDPYYAYQNEEGFSMPQYFEDYTKAYTPVEVIVNADWTDDSYTQIEATATLNWASLPDNQDAEYRVEFILVGDDLYGDTDDWNQSNYYANYYYGDLEYMEQFCSSTEKHMPGLHFNDVGLMSSGIGGIINSIPTIEPGTPNVVKHTFTPADAINASYQTIAFHPWALRVVAVVLEAGKGAGKGLNAGRCDVPIPAGINSVVATAEVLSTNYVNLAGQCVKNPTSGIYVKISTMSDGSCKAEKVIIR